MIKLSDIKDLKTTLGQRVRALRDFSGVPSGTEGVIDEIYFNGHPGVMIAWDLAESPLPAGYTVYDGAPLISSGILRDGFGRDKGFDETQYLELLPKKNSAAK